MIEAYFCANIRIINIVNSLTVLHFSQTVKKGTERMQVKTGSDNSDLTVMNRSAIVKILQRQEVCSCGSLAKQTGLTQAAITKIVAVLMEMGIVTEVGSIRGNGNCRSIGLTLNAGKHQVIGVKFARQMFAVGVFDISGKLYTKTETEYPLDVDRKSVLTAMKAQIHDALQKYKNVVAIVRNVVKQRTLPDLYYKVQIKISSLHTDPTLYGAAAIATDKVLSLPSAFTAGAEKK